MMLFGFWLLAGVVLGMILMAFLAIGTYQRGYHEGYSLRKPWKAELRSRHDAAIRVYEREMKTAGASRVVISASSREAVVPSVVASSG